MRHSARLTAAVVLGVAFATSTLPVGSANAAASIKVTLPKQATVLNSGTFVALSLTLRCPDATTAQLQVTVVQGTVSASSTPGDLGTTVGCTGKKEQDQLIGASTGSPSVAFDNGAATVTATLTDAGATDTDTRKVTIG